MPKRFAWLRKNLDSVSIHLLQVLSVAVYNHYKRIYNNTPNQLGNNRQDMSVMEQGPHQNMTHRGKIFCF